MLFQIWGAFFIQLSVSNVEFVMFASMSDRVYEANRYVCSIIGSTWVCWVAQVKYKIDCVDFDWSFYLRCVLSSQVKANKWGFLSRLFWALYLQVLVAILWTSAMNRYCCNC